jgi:hypothetical protein
MDSSLSAAAVRSLIEKYNGTTLPNVPMPSNTGSGAGGLDYHVAVLASVASAVVIEIHKTG